MIGPAGAGCGLIGVAVFFVSGFLGDDWTTGFLVVDTTCEIIHMRFPQQYLLLALKYKTQ